MKNFDIAIVGGGAAGVMAALRANLNNDSTLLFLGNGKSKKRSRAQWVARVDNIPGFGEYKKGIVNSNQEALKRIEDGVFKDKFKKLSRTIENIEKTKNGFLLTDDKGEKYEVKYVVLATGVMDVQPLIQGSIDPILPYANVQLIDYCIRCDGHHVHGKKTIVIGHGDGAAWTAVMLKERYDIPELRLLTNGEKPVYSKKLQELIEVYNFKIETSPIKSIEGNAKETQMESFTLEDGTIVPAQAGFVSLGMIIYNDLAKKLKLDLDDRGFIKTNLKGETSLMNIYAIGDIQAGKKNQIYTSWDMAVEALDDINGKIRTLKRENLLAQR